MTGKIAAASAPPEPQRVPKQVLPSGTLRFGADARITQVAAGTDSNLLLVICPVCDSKQSLVVIKGWLKDCMLIADLCLQSHAVQVF